MKKIQLLAFMLSVILLESCNPTQKMTVYGTPGTVITNLNGTQILSVIDQSGSTQVKLGRNGGYCAFLQAKAPDSDKYIPFALDYKDINRSTINLVAGAIIVYPLGFLGPSWILFNRIGGSYDYDYLETQSTNNDLIR